MGFCVHCPSLWHVLAPIPASHSSQTLPTSDNTCHTTPLKLKGLQTPFPQFQNPSAPLVIGALQWHAGSSESFLQLQLQEQHEESKVAGGNGKQDLNGMFPNTAEITVHYRMQGGMLLGT